MELEKISTVVRPRSQWEAIDLGFLMARQWFFPLLKVWLVLTLPLFIILHGILFTYPWAPILVIWWLKPLWERALLHIVSRALFSEVPTLRQTLSAFPKLAAKQWFMALTFRRLSLSRSMNLPVEQLENLSGTDRAKRLKTLHGTRGTGAGWLLFICVHIEAVLPLACMILISLFIPSEVDIEWFNLFVNNNYASIVIWNILFYFSMAVIAPFYVTAGFSLYINRRIWLEGWNIEIAFRRLSQRIKNNHSLVNLAVILIAGTLTITTPDTAIASETNLTPHEAKQTIETILAGEEFHNKKTIRALDLDFDWDDDDNDDIFREDASPLQSFTLWISENIRVILWVIFLTLAVYIIYKYREWLMQFSQYEGANKNSQSDIPPSVLFGMKVDKESLPQDVISNVESLWNQQQFRAAYSLLYRATLQRLMEHHQIKFKEGNTEEECKKLVIKHVPAELGNFFSEMTLHWQRLAYAHSVIDSDKMVHLCSEWRKFFNHEEATQHG